MKKRGDVVWGAGFDYNDDPQVRSARVVAAGTKEVRVDQPIPGIGRYRSGTHGQPGEFSETKNEALRRFIAREKRNVENAQAAFDAACGRLAKARQFAAKNAAREES